MSKGRGYAVIGMLALALALPACQGQAAQEADDRSGEAAEQTSTEILGGWTTNDEVSGAALSDDERSIFERATADLAGVGYEPVSVLATQVVSGTNYAYLCLGDAVTAKSDTSWYVVAVYEDLEGNASVSSAKEIDLANVSVMAAADKDETSLIGGWTLTSSGPATLPADAQGAFGAAYGDYDELSLLPIALLGRQLVSGTNYKLLCDGTTAGGEHGLYVVDVYESLDGEASITSAEQLALLSYV